MTTLEKIMRRPVELGEPAPRPAALRPSFVPKIVGWGAVLVVFAQLGSPYIVEKVEKARAEARQEAAAQDAREKARGELERLAGKSATQATANRNAAWQQIEAFRQAATDHANELDRDAYRRALEAKPAPVDLPANEALDLSAAILADQDAFAERRDAPTANKALADYQAATQRVAEYRQQLEVERRNQFAALRRQPRAAAQAPQAPSWEPAPRVTSGAPSARLPAPRPAPEPAQPAKRQVTDW